MKKSLGIALAALAGGALFSAAASAQVVVGGGIEYWMTRSDYNVADEAGNTVAKGTIKYDQPGLNLFGGKGDFIAFVNARAGDGNLDLGYAAGSIADASLGEVTTRTRITQEDREIGLRWTALRTERMAAYLVAGYSWTDYEEEETLTNNPGLVWNSTGTRTRRDAVKYRAPFIGVGSVTPLSERFGVRFEARLKFFEAEREASGRPEVSDNGVGGDITSAAYLKAGNGWGLQLGGRFTHLDGGDAISAVSRWSWFAVLDYEHRF